MLSTQLTCTCAGTANQCTEGSTGACGAGHISSQLVQNGPHVASLALRNTLALHAFPKPQFQISGMSHHLSNSSSNWNAPDEFMNDAEFFALCEILALPQDANVLDI